MRLIRALIAVSFLLNAAALVVPFVDISEVFGGTDTYHLTSSVRLLWDSGLYVLAAAVVVFSIVFPFAKLAVLAAHARGVEPSPRSRRLLAVVVALGKWSMVDVFIVCFILALASDQFFVGARPRPGLVVFLAAILASCLAGELLARRLGVGPDEGVPRSRRPLRTLVLLLATLAFAGLLAVPFVQIDDWLLEDTEFTLLTFLGALHSEGAHSVAIALAAGLVLAPAWVLAASWRVVLFRAGDGPLPAWVRAGVRARHFSLLEVFLVALAIFLAEGDAWMGVVPRRGLAFLIALLAIDVAHAVVTRPARHGPARFPEDAAAPWTRESEGEAPSGEP